MKGIKVVKRTDKEGVYCSGDMGGSVYTEFKVGETYSVDGFPELCSNGFHFFDIKNYCFGIDYYEEGEENTVYLEIKAVGEVVSDTFKCATNKIKIIRIVSKGELKIDENENSGHGNSGNRNSGNINSGNINSGHGNSGNYNSGNYNSGDGNSGNWNSGEGNTGKKNSGDGNSGNWNSGEGNSGHSNSGNRNTGNNNSGNNNSGHSNSGNRNTGNNNSGNYNSGHYNSGNNNSGHSNSGNNNSGNWNSGDENTGNNNSGYYNSGDWNSGNWNSGDGNTGHFNSTTPEKIRVFDKECDIETWDFSKKPNFIFYEKNISMLESFNQAKKKEDWNEELEKLINLPNFDYEVFEKITGISKEMLHN